MLTAAQVGLITGTAEAVGAGATIAVGAAPLGVAIDSVGHRAYVARQGFVSVIDTTDNSVVGNIPVAGKAWDVALDASGSYLYATVSTAGAVVKIDTAQRTVVGSPISVGGTPEGIAIDSVAHRAYVANLGSKSVSVIDTQDDSVQSPVSLPTSSAPNDVAVDPGAHRVYATSAAGNDRNTYAINTVDGSITTLHTGDYTYGVAIDPISHVAYVGSAQNNALFEYDTQTDTFLRRVPLGFRTSFGIAVDHSAHVVYVANRDGNSVTVVDTTSNDVGPTFAVGTSPFAVAVDSRTHDAYVANAGSANVSTVRSGTATQPQAISFTSTPPDNARVDGSYEVSATGGASGNPVTFSIDGSSDTGTCTVVDQGDSTGTVSFTGAGTCLIDADQAGNDDYTAAPQAQQSVTVAGRDAQTITFTSTPPSPAYVGDDYTATATGGASGTPVTFSSGASTTDGACTVDDQGDGSAAVSFTGVGTCEVAADQAGGAGYDAAPQAVQDIDVTQQAPAATYQVTDTVPFGGSFNTIAVDSGAHRAYVTNTGSNSVAVVDTKTHKVVDTVAVGPSPYGIALDTTADRAYVANDGNGTISVIDTDDDSLVTTISGIGAFPDGVAVDPGTHQLYVTRNNNQVSVIDTTNNTFIRALRVGSEPTAVAVDTANHTAYVTNASSNTVSVIDTTANGGVVKTIGVGSRPVRVAVDSTSHQAYVTNFESASVSVIDTQAQSLAATVQVGTRPFGIGVDPVDQVAFATNYADNTVSVIDETDNAVLQTVTVGSAPGSAAVDTSTHAAFVVNGGDGTLSVIERTGTPPPANQSQAITFTTEPPSPAYVGDSYTVRASGGGSGNPVTFSTDMFDPDPDGDGEPNCIVSDNGDSTASVYFSETGTCDIYADQAGADGYDAAPQAVQTFTIGRHAQAITFTSTPPSPAYAGTDYAVSATGGDSGNNVTFTAGDDTTDGACAVTNNGGSTATVQLTGAGTCDVVASQAGSNAYAAAPQQHQTFDVVRQPQAITFTSGAPTSAKVGGSYTVSASGGGSGNAVTLTKDASSDPGACTVSDNGDSTAKVSFTGRGDCVIDADQAGSRAYDAAPQAQQTVSVSPRAQHITLSDNSPVQSRVGKSYTVKGTGGASGKPVTFSKDASSDAGTCTVTDNGDSTATVTFTGNGSCIVDGDQAGAKGFTQAPQAQLPLATGATRQAITITSAKQARYPVDTSYTVTAKAGASGNAVVFRIDGTTTAGCDIVGGGQNGTTYSATVAFSGVGQCVVVANEAGSATYQPAPQLKLPLKVNAAQQAITFTTTPPDPGHVGGTYDVAATGGASGNPVTFSIANPTKASCSIVSTGSSTARVTFNLTHPCVILADQAASADGNYNSAPTARQVVTVKK